MTHALHRFEDEAVLLEPKFQIPREAQRIFLPYAHDGEMSLADLGRLMPVMAGGAEIFPNEGLDKILNIFPKTSVSVPTTVYMGLFTSQTASTVPSADAVLSTYAGTAAPAEPTLASNAYARQSMAAGASGVNWGTPATSGSGRRLTYSQVSFPASTGSWGTINGFFLCDSASHGSEIAYYYANFADVTAVPITVSGYTLQITPFWHVDQ